MRHFFSLILAVVLGASLFPTAPASASYRCEEYPQVVSFSFPEQSSLAKLEQLSFQVKRVDPDTIRFLLDGMPPAKMEITEAGLSTYNVVVTLQQPLVTRGDYSVLITGSYISFCPLRYTHSFSINGRYDGTSTSSNGSTGTPITTTTGHIGGGEAFLFSGTRLTRAEATASALSRFVYIRRDDINTSFTDISSVASSYEYLITAELLNIARGYDDHTFRPNDTTSRAEALALALRSAGYDEKNYGGYPFTGFNDVDHYTWYADMIGWAKQEGIIHGYDDGSFRPNAVMSQEEYIVLLDSIAAYKNR